MAKLIIRKVGGKEQEKSQQFKQGYYSRSSN